MNPMKIQFIIIVLLMSCTMGYSQTQHGETTGLEKISGGIGVGFDYGGLGINLLVYPHRNIGMFVGVGYAVAGVGSNVGVKVKIKDGSKISPYLLGMYGYNSAIKVKGASHYNRMFYGPSFGLGIDLKLKRHIKGYFSFALLVPVRSSDVDDYIDALKNTGGISFENKLLPIGFSVGYHIVIK